MQPQSTVYYMIKIKHMKLPNTTAPAPLPVSWASPRMATLYHECYQAKHHHAPWVSSAESTSSPVPWASPIPAPSYHGCLWQDHHYHQYYGCHQDYYNHYTMNCTSSTTTISTIMGITKTTTIIPQALPVYYHNTVSLVSPGTQASIVLRMS